MRTCCRTRERVPDHPDEFFVRPEDVASRILALVQAFGEKW